MIRRPPKSTLFPNDALPILAVDNVVICAGQDSLTELMPPVGKDGKPLASGGPRFHKIGGAALAAELDAKRAIREGAVLAASL